MCVASPWALANRTSWGSLVTTVAVGAAGIMAWHGHAAASMHSHTVAATGRLDAAVNTAAMMAAMMTPLVANSAGLIAERSLTYRRPIAVAEHAISFAAVWFLFSLCLTPLMSAASAAVTSAGAFAGACVISTAWQLSHRRSQYVDRCSRVRTAPPLGWRADLGSLIGGGYEGMKCVRTCWAAMLAMIASPGMAVMALIWAAHLWEWSPRRNPFAKGRSRKSAAFYAMLALLWLSALVFPS